MNNIKVLDSERNGPCLARFPLSTGACQTPGTPHQLSTGFFKRWGVPYLQAHVVGLIGLQRNDVFTGNVGPFFLTTFMLFFVFSVGGTEPVDRFLLVFMLFSFWTLGEIANPGILRQICGEWGQPNYNSPTWRVLAMSELVRISDGLLHYFPPFCFAFLGPSLIQPFTTVKNLNWWHTKSRGKKRKEKHKLITLKGKNPNF